MFKRFKKGDLVTVNGIFDKSEIATVVHVGGFFSSVCYVEMFDTGVVHAVPKSSVKYYGSMSTHEERVPLQLKKPKTVDVICKPVEEIVKPFAYFTDHVVALAAEVNEDGVDFSILKDFAPFKTLTRIEAAILCGQGKIQTFDTKEDMYSHLKGLDIYSVLTVGTYLSFKDSTAVWVVEEKKHGGYELERFSGKSTHYGKRRPFVSSALKTAYVSGQMRIAKSTREIEKLLYDQLLAESVDKV
ncbi:hypothetical protein CPT_Saba_016 [Proteus phage Saba]|uniref:Uncharacterized protein n=1 Tax=Proteus phage Saba TaxID=2596672 RepID=A0A5B9N723_9CAUD|nr:hypothetical protein JT320_gp16 [Proteus phage Saba]QEG09389.1 hypothetical protein CPT_Saba_016 [Proteus phage Saba]